MKIQHIHGLLGWWFYCIHLISLVQVETWSSGNLNLLKNNNQEIWFLDNYSEAWILNNGRLYASSHVKLYIKVQLLLHDFSKLDVVDVYQISWRGMKGGVCFRWEGILVLFPIFSRDVLLFFRNSLFILILDNCKSLTFTQVALLPYLRVNCNI